MKTYDPKKVLVIFGTRQLKGMAEDSIVSIAPQGEGLQTFVGADGEVARSLDPNATFEVTVSLSTASTSNEYLSNMYNYDRETGNGVAPPSSASLLPTVVTSPKPTPRAAMNFPAGNAPTSSASACSPSFTTTGTPPLSKVKLNITFM